MQTSTQLAEQLSEFATVHWIPRLPNSARVRASRIMSLIHLRLGMLSRPERMALAECLAKVQWYQHCGHLVDGIEIPRSLRPVIRRAVRDILTDILIPPHELEHHRRWWRLPWRLGKLFGVSERVAQHAVRLRQRRGKPPVLTGPA